MDINVKEITVSALKLPRRSRALIADVLLDSLEEDAAESYQEEWLEVARNRDTEMAEGATASIDHDQVVSAVRKAVRCSK